MAADDAGALPYFPLIGTGRPNRAMPPSATLLAFVTRPGLAIAMALALHHGNLCRYSLPLQAAFAETVPAHLRGRGFGLFSSGLMTAQGLRTDAVGALAAAIGRH